MPLPPRDHRLSGAGSATVLDVVARRARASSDGALVGCAAAGLVGAATIGVAWPALWPFALPWLAAAGFGAWGVADRAASEMAGAASPSPLAVGLLLALRLAAGMLGVAAVVGFLLALATRTVVTTGGGWF